MFKMFFSGVLAIALASAVVTGASANNDARVRVIHASPDAPNVDVYANEAKVLSNVPFGASSGYLAVPAGAYTFEVYAAGANPAADDAVLTVDANLAADTDYTVVALNKVAEIEAAAFTDDNRAPAQGKAHIYVVHAGPDAPAVDIAVAGGPVLVQNLAFGKRGGPLLVDAGTYDLEVRPTGPQNVALPLDGVSLEAGKIYTFVASGFLQGTPALTVLPFAEDPRTVAPGHMAPPRAGDAGLLNSSSGDNSHLYGVGAAMLMVLIGLGGIARRMTSRR